MRVKAFNFVIQRNFSIISVCSVWRSGSVFFSLNLCEQVRLREVVEEFI